MKKLKEHIKNKKFYNIYIMYGDEKYTKDIYEKKLVKAILNEEEKMMNFDYFEEKSFDVDNVIDACITPPFMSQYRLVLIKNSNIFMDNKANIAEKMIKYAQDLCSSTILIFIEEKVDKRLKLFKKLKDIAYIYEFSYLKEDEMVRWIHTILEEKNKTIDTKDAYFFIRYVGANMQNLYNEMDKLASYSENTKIQKDDIINICTKSMEGKIFDLIDCIIAKKTANAISIYRNLIMQKVSPFIVMNMLTRQIRIIFKAKYLRRKGYQNKEIADALGTRAFIVAGAIEQAKGFTNKSIIDLLNEMLELDNSIKTGKTIAEDAVEMLILKYSIV